MADASSSAEAAQRACLSGPDARGEVQNARSPKITFRVRLPNCPLSPSPRETGVLPVTLGAEGHRWRSRCVAAARERRAGVKEAAGPRRADGFNVRVDLYPCSGPGGIFSPAHYPADPQLAAPPLPAATGAPPAPLRLAEPAFWAPPTSPPWQLLPSAVRTQTASGSDKVTPPATGFGAAGGFWGGCWGARRLLKGLWTSLDLG